MSYMNKNSMKIENLKLKILFIGLILIPGLAYSVKPANADGISLSLSPSLIEIQTNPPSDLHVPLVLKNDGDDSIQVKPVYKLFKQSSAQNVQVEYLHSRDQKIFDKLSLLDNGQPVSSLSL